MEDPDYKYIDADGKEAWFHESTTPNQRAAIRAAATAARMERQDISNRVQALLREAPQEHLETLRIMFDMGTRDPAVNVYNHGAVATALSLRFDAFDHTAELLDGADDPATPAVPPAPEPAPEPEPAPQEPPSPTEPPAGFEDGSVVAPMSLSAIETNMRLYHVEPTGNGDEVRCTRCGATYVSLQDRMVKRPDDCHFCHERSAWGGINPEPMPPGPSPFGPKDTPR